MTSCATDPTFRANSQLLQSRLLTLIAILFVGISGCERKLQIGSKAFTENAILGEMAVLLAEQHDMPTEHTKELGTRNLWDALQNGELDLYPEYTGTLREEIFAGEEIGEGNDALREKMASYGVLATEPLGFNNTYALGMKESVAEELGIEKISDLRDHPELEIGFSNEFLNRADGWPSLRQAYRLPHKNLVGLEHGLAYRAVATDSVALTDVYSTDSSIARYGLRVLKDDLRHFPEYNALFIYRSELKQRAPKMIELLHQIEGAIDDAGMLALNQQVDLEGKSDQAVAAGWLRENLGIQATIHEPTLWERLGHTTLEHMFLVIVSLAAAIAFAVPLGVLAAKKPVLGQFIVGIAEIIQTIPGLALLILLAVVFAWLGWATLGPWPVIVALFLYSLLPIIRNTMAGISGVPDQLKESAIALGLTPKARLKLIELPLASRMILAGIKTTAVINVGYAALGGLIGAGGYGEPIMTGLRLNREDLMLEGAIPAAMLALVVKWGFEIAERRIVPEGLRLKASR